MNLIARQRGLTALGMVLLLSMLAFFVLLALRLAPLYIEAFKVESSMQSLASEADSAGKTPQELRTLLLRRLDVNDVDNVKSGDISISREDGETVISVSYAVQVPIVGNIDAVVSFEKRAKVGP